MSEPTQTVKLTRTIAAAAERVFDAWLDPKTAGKWLFATPAGKMVRVEIDARVGGRYVFVDRRDMGDIEHTGEYLEIDRPKRLVFTLVVPKFSTDSTRVSIDIVPLSVGTCQLTLTHEGVYQSYADQTQDGWGKLVAGLELSLNSRP